MYKSILGFKYKTLSCLYKINVVYRKEVDAPDPEQIRKDLERLEMIKKKRWAC